MSIGKTLRRQLWLATAAGAMVASPAVAHNGPVHKGRVIEVYRLMQLIDRMNRSHKTLGPPPAGVSQEEWVRFHEDIAHARARLNTMTGAEDEGLTGNAIAVAIGEEAEKPDDNIDDTHLFVKLGSTGAGGAAAKAGDEAAKAGIEAALIPIACLCDCFASLFGLGGDACDECVDHAKDLANEVPTPGDIANTLPGLGDITSGEFTGLWHFVNIAPGLPNTYDDHQGMLYEVSGPHQNPGGIDLLIMAGTDIAGLSVNPAKSNGVKHYEIPVPGDEFPDGDEYHGSSVRGADDWQKYPMAHIPFSPVDNLALYGWNRFRTQGHKIADLGYPLHALGDATVPTHVVGTTSWGHRPYEDAESLLYQAGKLTFDRERVLQKALVYRQQILAWRSKGHPGDVPVRFLVRELARHTREYALAKEQETYLATPTSPWPFNDVASLIYLTTAEETATRIYLERADAPDLLRPLWEDGLAAQLAFLVSAAETSEFAQGSAPDLPGALPPAPAELSLAPEASAMLVPASYVAQVDPRALRTVRPVQRPPIVRQRQPGAITDRRETPQADEGVARDFRNALRSDYAQLGRLFLTGVLTPAQYIQRVRDRSAKAALAERTGGYYEAYAQGDADGDLIPDDRDTARDTGLLAPTDETGTAVPDAREDPKREPGAASARDMRVLFSRANVMVSPDCASQRQPPTPNLQRLGYSSTTRDLMFAVTPTGQTSAKCRIFYEFSVHLSQVFPGNANWLEAESYRNVVFRSDQSVDLNPAGKNRLVFRIPRAAAQSGDRDYLLQNVARYGKVEWRVRAMNMNGMVSAWSDWKQGATPISFGEP